VVSKVKWEIFDVFEKIDNIVSVNVNIAYFLKKQKLESSFAELKAIGIKIKSSNISEYEKNNLLKEIAIYTNEKYLKLKSKIDKKKRKIRSLLYGFNEKC
jgi:hypothetical protein